MTKDLFFHLFFYPSQTEFKFSPSSRSLFAIHFPSNSDVTTQLTLALEQNQYQNTALGEQRSQTGNTGMPVPDNEEAKRRMGEILLPAVDLVVSPFRIPELF